ncbi:cardiolipin synthase [Noviherbaspirillum sp. CPCC 100848]|uniref:Cardiolipin synthase n=1 Tax=Noviherbaspirillum album TaxID=3080276 RepID=A0ABU6J7V9_9BURK|nr:cardiolipin synthase [Noviherbaspirillum sp. CPCC 100848]MEC4719696.1 cardiolipin synthase [Noviherbaspirillum sp. CPCC 100848]
MKRHFSIFHIIIAIALTAVVTILVANFNEGEKKIQTQVESLYAVTDPQFLRSMGVLLGPTIMEGNKVEHLENGREIFPSMLAAIRSAKHTITFETYIYWSGHIGKAFSDALSERARAGVKVHVLLDWIGSAKMDDEMLARLRDSGVEVERYHEPHWANLTRMNNRTHRKLLVVDGQVAFTGGVGIADLWDGDAQDKDHWRDSHFRVEGPAVSEFQAVFLDNWVKANGRVLHAAEYFPHIEPKGKVLAQMFSSSPTGGSESMHLMYLLSIASARQTILLANSYFVPDDLSVDALVAAARRGVKIRIITPGKYIDTEIVRRASRARWGRLLEAGIEIHEYQPTMFHCKIMIVDGFLVSTGSTNFDNRSFRLNDEANLNIYDANFAEEMTAEFEQDVARSRRITLEEWKSRPLQEKIFEHAMSLFGKQL